MQRSLVLMLAVLALWCGAGLNQARAQFGTLGQPPARRPAISPYINLGEGGNAFNYYGLVKPQIDANRALTDLQQNMLLLNPDGSAKGPLAQQNQAAALSGLQTGHPATFFNYGHYYPQNPYQGTTGGLAAGALNGGLGGYGLNPGVGGVGGVGGAGFGGAGFDALGVRTFFGNTMNNGPRR